ncbi:MAG: ExsB family protein [Deltaproteobacteria bacterium]|nr:MAG: ExsB family protein [Deltaproteobacteria bacterium]
MKNWKESWGWGITMNKNYRMCSRCVMDTTAGDISFDENGVCNYCTEFLERSSKVLFKDSESSKKSLDIFVNEIKKDGKDKPYDCIVGVSGGVDSSWVLVKTVELGLKPLAVHMDNGWNSELAQNNISNLVQKLGVPLHTHVINWEEYKSLMQAFFDADVIDVELLYDNAMLAVNYRMAAKYRLKHILSGTNLATEGMKIPSSWNWFKWDKKNIKAIGRIFQNVSLKTFPAIGTVEFILKDVIRGIKWESFLDYMDYNKFTAMEILQRDFDYKSYPYKHYESIFTRFYQGYILPEKFGIDKRKVHLATLVVSGQMSREDALEGLKGIAYPSERELKEDITYFLKKMNWTLDILENYLSRPEKPHSFYSSEKKFYDFCRKIHKKVTLSYT